MNRIISPLSANSTGAPVADLQDGLLLLLRRLVLQPTGVDLGDLLTGLTTERSGGVFGPITADTVVTFQMQHRLATTAEVDPLTAAALNTELELLGVFTPAPVAAVRTGIVFGQVKQAGQPVTGLRVRAVHSDGASEMRLGEDTTDAEGRYTIRYDGLPGLAALHLRVDLLSQSGTVVQSSAVLANATQVEVIDLGVSLAEPAAGTRRIEGRVVYEHGVAAENLRLRLYRQEFGGAAPTMLAEATAGEQGVYALAYEAGAKTSSFEMRAVDAAAVEVALTSVLHGIGEQEITYLNLVAPTSLAPLQPEFERMAADVAPQVGAMQNLMNAQENTDRQDFTLLSGATGWDARLIALASKAARLSAQPNVGVSQSVMYGLFRAGLPSDTAQLAQVSAEAVDKALTTATNAGIISLSRDETSAAKAAIANLQRDAQLATPIAGSRMTYNALLTVGAI